MAKNGKRKSRKRRMRNVLKVYRHPRIAHKGYLYHYHKECNQHIRWKCNRVFSLKCPCVLRTSTDMDDLRIIALDHEHVHSNEESSVAIRELKLSNLKEGNEAQSELLEFTENDYLKTKVEKRTHESEDIINNKKIKYSTSDLIPLQDEIAEITHVDSDNTCEINNKNQNIITVNKRSDLEFKNTETYSKVQRKKILPKVDNTIINTQNGSLFTQTEDINILDVNNLEFNNDKEIFDSENVFDDSKINSNDESDAAFFIKQNWPDTLEKLSDPFYGLKLFENILFKKMIAHIRYSSTIAKNQSELDRYKINENYWKSKFQLLSNKLSMIKKDVENLHILKNISVQTDTVDNQAEKLYEINTNYQLCQEKILNTNQKYLTWSETNSTDVSKNNEFNNFLNSIIDLTEDIQSNMEISETIPKSEISLSGKSNIQDYKMFTSEYNTQSTSGHLIATQVLVNPDDEFSKTGFNQTISSLDTYKLLNSNKMSLQKSTNNIVLTKSHDITHHRMIIGKKESALNSSTNPVEIKNYLSDICQNTEQVDTIDLTSDSESDVDIGPLLKSKSVPLSLPIIQDLTSNSNELMPVNVTHSNINNALPRPKLGIKLEVSQDNTMLNIFLSWTHKQVNGIASYELYCYAAIGDDSIHNPWKLIAELSALPIPMTVNLKLDSVKSWEMYYFSVRAKDEFGRYGFFSTPISTRGTEYYLL